MVTIQLPADVLERVDRLAARKDCTRDEVISTALVIGVRDEERAQDVIDALDGFDASEVTGASH